MSTLLKKLNKRRRRDRCCSTPWLDGKVKEGKKKRHSSFKAFKVDLSPHTMRRMGK
jgi:hypothetical protein